MSTSSVTPDPTAVVGRRVIAFLVDLVSLGLVSALSLLVTGSLTQVTADNLKQFKPTDRTLELGESIYVIQPSLLTWLIPVLFFVGMMVALQGLTGMTLGKAATGIRSVGSDGGAPGIGRALVRSLFAAVGILASVATWMQLSPGWADFPRFAAMLGVFGLVGAITAVMASTSAGHRRLGDRLSGTFVVDRSFAGRPLRISGSGVETMDYETIDNETIDDQDDLAPERPVSAVHEAIDNRAAQTERVQSEAAQDLWNPKPLPTPKVDLPPTEATPITVESNPLVGAVDTPTDLFDRGRSALGANDAIGDITSDVSARTSDVAANVGDASSNIAERTPSVGAAVGSFTPHKGDTTSTFDTAAAAGSAGVLGGSSGDVVDVTTSLVDVTTSPVDVTTSPVDVTTSPVDVTTSPVDDAAATEDPTTPRWDPDRQAYIVWDQSRAEWLEYDESRQAWKQISRA